MRGSGRRNTTDGEIQKVNSMNRLPGLMHLPDDMGQIDEGTNPGATR